MRYIVPGSRLRPNMWGWWWGLSVLGGMIGEFLAGIPAAAAGRFIMGIDNGQLQKAFPGLWYLEPFVYSLVCGIGLGVCHWFVTNRMDDPESSPTQGWLWLGSWISCVLIEVIFRKSPYHDRWIVRSMVVGLVAGSLGGGIQWLILRHKLSASSIWIVSNALSLMVGFVVFRFFVRNRLGTMDGIYHSSYYLGRLYQWAIYGLLTGLTLEGLIRTTNKQRSA